MEWAPGALLMLVAPLLGGLALVRALGGGAGLLAAGLGFPVAMGAMGTLYLASYLAGVPAGAWRLVELLLAVAAGAMAWRVGLFRRRPGQTAPRPAAAGSTTRLWTGRGVAGGLLLVAAAAALVQAVHGVAAPHGNWDALAIWNMHARFIFRDASRALLYLDGGMQWTHPEYPLLLPSLIARGWTLNGGQSQLIPWLLGQVQVLSAAALLYGRLAHQAGGSRLQARLALLALLGTPMVLISSGSQYADMMLACLVLVAATAFLTWLERADNRWLALAGAAAGLGAGTKIEGYMLVAALTSACLAAVIKARRGRPALPALAWLGAGLGPGLAGELLFRLVASSRLPHRPQYGWRQVSARLLKPGRYLTTGMRFASEPLRLGKWSLMPLLLLLYPLATGLSRERRLGPAMGAGGLVLLMLALYFGIYIALPGDLGWYLNMSLERLMLHSFPAFILVSFSLGGGRLSDGDGAPAGADR